MKSGGIPKSKRIGIHSEQELHGVIRVKLDLRETTHYKLHTFMPLQVTLMLKQ